jgi:hypothetical protein
MLKLIKSLSIDTTKSKFAKKWFEYSLPSRCLSDHRERGYNSRIIRVNCMRGRKILAVAALSVCIGLSGSLRSAWSQIRKPVECDLPPVDIPGENMPGFPRFPGAVRVQYIKDSDRFSFTEKTKIKGAMTKFLSTSDMKTLMDFYNKEMADKGWKIISSQYISSEKATLTLEKEPNRIILTLEPEMKPAPAPANPNRANRQNRPMFVRSKCYSISIFLYKIPPPEQNTDNAMTGFQSR